MPVSPVAKEWTTIWVPVTESPDRVQDLSATDITWPAVLFDLDPSLHEGRAIPSICQVKPDLPLYVLEVAPLRVVTRAAD